MKKEEYGIEDKNNQLRTEKLQKQQRCGKNTSKKIFGKRKQKQKKNKKKKKYKEKRKKNKKKLWKKQKMV